MSECTWCNCSIFELTYLKYYVNYTNLIGEVIDIENIVMDLKRYGQFSVWEEQFTSSINSIFRRMLELALIINSNIIEIELVRVTISDAARR